MGNVYKNSLDEIWSGDAFRMLREENLKLKFDKTEFCGDCESRVRLKSPKENGEQIDIGVRKMFIFEKDEDR